MMQIDDLPKIMVQEIIDIDDRSIIIGSVDHWKWVGEGYSAYLFICDKEVIKGEFQDVNEISGSVKFISTGSASNNVRKNEAYPFFDGYWGQRASLIFNSSLHWEKNYFKLRDTIKHKDDGSTELVKDGWDHEHCFICWATIDLYQNTAYINSNEDDIVCLGCFENYISKKSIDFITD